VWGQSITRTLSGAVGGSLGRLFRSGQKARLAALDAEVVALRVTVAQMREAVATAEAAATALAAELAATRELLTAPAQGPAALPPAGPPVALELPLVRLALARTAGRTLSREMAAALATADRSPDTARTEIVLADLPERELLDPVADRGAAPVDPAAAAATTPPAEAGADRRIA
jgi:hypothetical protein